MNYKIMGDNIRRVRKSINMTQEKLAECIDVSSVFISQIENGARKPSLETIYNLSVVLKTPVDDLLKNVMPIETFPDFDELSLLLKNRTKSEINFATSILKELLENLKNGSIIEK